MIRWRIIGCEACSSCMSAVAVAGEDACAAAHSVKLSDKPQRWCIGSVVDLTIMCMRKEEEDVPRIMAEQRPVIPFDMP